MAEINPHHVAVDQVWMDNDKRSAGRMVRVVAIEPVTKQAVVRPCDPGGRFIGARITRIRLDRFKPTSTGYQLVTAADGER